MLVRHMPCQSALGTETFIARNATEALTRNAPRSAFLCIVNALGAVTRMQVNVVLIRHMPFPIAFGTEMLVARTASKEVFFPFRQTCTKEVLLPFRQASDIYTSSVHSIHTTKLALHARA